MSQSEDEEASINFVESKTREVQRRIKGARIVVALFGAGGSGLKERRSIAQELTSIGVVVVIPEDALPAALAPSLLERLILSSDDLDLVFVNVDSWGSAAEFSEFRNNQKVAPKLRVLVERDYHPLYGSSKGYLTDAYLTHDAVFGHVYMYRKTNERSVDRTPTPRDIVLTISERYRQWKALSST